MYLAKLIPVTIDLILLQTIAWKIPWNLELERLS